MRGRCVEARAPDDHYGAPARLARCPVSGEAVYLREAEGSCDVHQLEGADAPRILFERMRASHPQGGNVCVDCLRRIKAIAASNLGIGK